MIELFNNLVDLLIENKLIIMSFLAYKAIGYLSNKIDISSYSYEGKDDLLNDVKIVWFNADYSKSYNENKKIKSYYNLFYRFKIDIEYFNNSKPPLKNHIHILNRYEILFLDRIRLISFFLREYIYKSPRKKELPKWFLRTYIFPNTIFI
jgi:hypothetical protein